MVDYFNLQKLLDKEIFQSSVVILEKLNQCHDTKYMKSKNGKHADTESWTSELRSFCKTKGVKDSTDEEGPNATNCDICIEKTGNNSFDN